jgi:hypothetical protein
LDFACFLRFLNHLENYLVQPVTAAATTQVKLCPYDDEEPHIWFGLIEAQFAAAGIKSQNSNTPMPLPACPSKSFRTFSTQ